MELTDENQDGMDCRPPGRSTGIRTPARLRAPMADRAARQEAATQPPQPDPPEEAPASA